MIDESWYHRPEGVPERIGAGGVVVRVAGQRVFVALARERGARHFILPKGGVEMGESLEEAARREILEEAGLDDLRLLADLGTCERLNYSGRKWTKTHYFLFITESRGGEPRDKRNRYEPAAWHAIESLPQMFWPDQRELIEENRELIVETALKSAGGH